MSTVLVVHTGELGELLATQFDQYGLACAHAKNGETALELALHERPQAVVVDADLPDVGGLELAELLKAELSVPVVVTYGRALELGEGGDAFLARTAQLDGAFAKPFRSLALIGTVADLIGTPLEPAPNSQEGFPIDEVVEVGDDDVLLLEDVVEQVLHADPHALDAALSILDEAAAEDDDPFADLEIDEAEPERTTAEEGASVSLSEFVAGDSASDPATLALLWKKVREQPAPPQATMPVRPAAREAVALTPKALTETLDAFHNSQSTGEVWIDAGEVRRALLIEGGAIVGSRSNAPTEELVRLSVKRGLVTPDEAGAALAAVKAGEATDFAAALLAAGATSASNLRGVLAERVKRVVCGAFMAQQGSLKVTHRNLGEKEATKFRVPVADALSRAIILTEPLEALRQAAPDDARFAPEVGGAYGLDELVLTADEAYLVVAMDGTKTVGDLKTLFDSIPERTLRGLPSALHRIGLVRLAGRGHAEPKRISFF